MRIGELAQRAGVTAKTLRFYEHGGLLRDPGRTPYRDYHPGVLDRLTSIHAAQGAGFTLRQIRQVLDIRDTGQPPCEHVGALIAERLADVERRIAELEHTRQQLRDLARRTAELDPADCHGYCAIIQT
jgi:DNA-binding transcriptional MerR regulator